MPTEKEASPPTSPGPLLTGEFAKYVETCRKSNSSEIIENLATEHATIVLSELLKFSADTKSNIDIVSGEFYVGVWGRLHTQLDSALKAGCSVRAIVLCDEDKISDLAFFRKIQERGQAATLSPPPSPAKHFYLSGRAYRVEVDDRLRKAYASFNDDLGLMTDPLRSDFETLWKLGKRAGGSGNGGSLRAG